MTDTLLDDFCMNPDCPYMNEIYMGHCGGVSGNGVDDEPMIAKGCPNMMLNSMTDTSEKHSRELDGGIHD